MKRLIILLFGLFSYAIFFATFLYLIAFVGNLQNTPLTQWLPWLPAIVPYSIDSSRATGSIAAAVAINLGLILAFGLQHSVMARMGFKSWLKNRLPASAERSVYVLLASLLLILLFWQWRPIPDIVWAAESTIATNLGWIVFAGGFAIVLVATFLIDHFDLFGLRQVWAQFRGQKPASPQFVTPMLYRLVRHPLYLGFLLAFWGGPVMTVGHLLFAMSMTVYVLIAIRLEERDLMHFLGQEYADYRMRVPMLIPGTKIGSRSRSGAGMSTR
ncbi:MAG: methanethiol S-methyltransferase [Wenzhouxiangellaceae bacterium]